MPSTSKTWSGGDRFPTNHDHSLVLAQIRKVTGEELEVALANREKPMIVDFYADWCGPCVLLAKELEQVSMYFFARCS